MVVFYSRNGATKKFAQALAKVKGDRLFELSAKGGRGNLVVEVFRSLTKKNVELLQMPKLGAGETAYLCTPVWAGTFPAAMRSFINGADLKGRPVKLLLTCGDPNTQQYADGFTKQMAEMGIEVAGCVALRGKEDPANHRDALEAL